MKTYFLTLMLFVSAPFWMSAQTSYVCGSDVARKKLILEHPEALINEAELDEFTKDFENNWEYFRANRSGPYIIPLVFHIIHQGGPENISDAQVIDEVRILNDDYNKRNADTAGVIASFKSIIANVGVEFRLANLDPYGNCTNGIERINSCQTYMGNDFSKLNSWPRERYLNVWVVKSMMDGVAGYAYYPGSVQAIYATPARDGVIILSDYIGSIGTGSAYDSRALTHEIGHYLNLKHPWGDTNNPGISCGDDDVNDTPITRGSNLSCNLNLAYCSPPIIENVQNYMDYSYCSKMFTEGQKVRMLAALESNKSDRNNLYTAANLVATGTDDTTYNKCAPKADFSATKRYICVGGSATLLDASGNGDVTDYYWEIPNGNPATSTAKNPSIQFLVPGWQPIKLTVSNGLGISVKTDTFLIYVANDIASYQAPFVQGFEESNILDINEWSTANYDENLTSFKQVNYARHSGTGSLQLNNYFSRADHDIDEVVSPGFDLSGLTTSQMQLSFYYSWASAANSFAEPLVDSMEVLASGNCGTTWGSIYKKGTHSGSAVLLNAGSVQGFYVPGQADILWKNVKFTIPPAYKLPNVHFKFRIYSSVRGNNFYLDDVNIGAAVTGISEPSQVSDVNIYPNPTEGDATLNLALATAGKVSVTVLDITGKEVANVFEGALNDGDTQLQIHGSSLLSAGVYIVNIKAADSVVQRKLVIK